MNHHGLRPHGFDKPSSLEHHDKGCRIGCSLNIPVPQNHWDNDKVEEHISENIKDR